MLKRRKEIYEIRHPETKQYSSEQMKNIRRGEIISSGQAAGMNKKLGNNVAEIISTTFAEETSKKIGVSKSTIEKEIKIAMPAAPKGVDNRPQGHHVKTQGIYQ